MSQFFRTWHGTLTSSWDKPGSSPRSFKVHLAKKSSGKLKGKGTSYDGRKFTIKHGTYINIGPRYGLEFDIVYDDGSPTERFSGTEGGTGHIKATIKLKDAHSLITPGMMGNYEDYRDYRAFVDMK